MRFTLATSLLLGATATTATDISACSSGQLGQLVALLEDYAPALSYCSMLVPATAPTTATTITQCQPEATHNVRRRDDTELDDYDPSDSKPQAFTKLKRSKQASYDVCTCLRESPRKVYITETCSSTQYCDATQNVCAPKRNCKNPAHCLSESYVSSGDCFCHPDTDDSTAGYCMTTGPGCPNTYEDCSSNAACGGGSRVCIYACCREEPFCVDLNDYEPDYATSSRKLFRRARSVLDDSSSVNPRWL